MALPVSLRHVAKAAGVGTTAASMALRDHPRISAATRERVQRVARELGYRPDPEVAKVMGIIREKKIHHDHPVLALITQYSAAV